MRIWARTLLLLAVVVAAAGSLALLQYSSTLRAAMTRSSFLGGALGLLFVGTLGLTVSTAGVLGRRGIYQPQTILDIACESMERLREGLTAEAADAVCRLLVAHSPAAAVAITDTERILGFAGVGREHHIVGGPIVLEATRAAIVSNARNVAHGRERTGCDHRECLLRSAVVVPLQIAGGSGGTLGFYFRSPRRPSRASIALADGLGRLLSMRLDLDQSHGELAYLAAHDPLTRLSNRRAFEAAFQRELSEHRRLGETGALLWFDLDDFKDINDGLGHVAGDDLLVAFADKIRSESRDYCTLARVGGDEFGMLVPHADEIQARATASRLLEMLSDTSFSVAGHKVRVSASIGLVRFPEHGESCDELMARADLAMYEAKATGGNRFIAYTHDDSWRSRMTKRIEIAEQILSALRENRLELYAQPMRCLADDSTAGYELLLRMIDTDGTIVMPDDIIPTAERLGMIRDIDRWVARRAIKMLGDECAAGRDTRFNINLSGAAFSDPDLLQIMRDEFRIRKAQPSHLIVEITETSAIADFERAREFIRALKEVGCRFSLDDFGSGFSSFYYLKHLPVDFLKIDGSLVKSLTAESPDTHFVRAILEMCRGLNIQTVAEYVESATLLDAVNDQGVDFAQGYEVGWPEPLDTYIEGAAQTSDAVAGRVGARSPESDAEGDEQPHPWLLPAPPWTLDLDESV